MVRRAAWVCGLVACAITAAACRETPSKEVDVNPSESPQAKAVPAPLTTESAPVSIGSVRPLVADAGEVPALRARPDRELAADTGGKDTGGFGGVWTVRPENAWSAPRSATRPRPNHPAAQETGRARGGNQEPRISVDSVKVTRDEAEPSCLVINTSYTIRGTNTRYNMVYPFYVMEATLRGA